MGKVADALARESVALTRELVADLERQLRLAREALAHLERVAALSGDGAAKSPRSAWVNLPPIPMPPRPPSPTARLVLGVIEADGPTTCGAIHAALERSGVRRSRQGVWQACRRLVSSGAIVSVGRTMGSDILYKVAGADSAPEQE